MAKITLNTELTGGTIETIVEEIRLLIEAKRQQLIADSDRLSTILSGLANVAPVVVKRRRGRPAKA